MMYHTITNKLASNAKIESQSDIFVQNSNIKEYKLNIVENLSINHVSINVT